MGTTGARTGSRRGSPLQTRGLTLGWGSRPVNRIAFAALLLGTATACGCSDTTGSADRSVAQEAGPLGDARAEAMLLDGSAAAPMAQTQAGPVKGKLVGSARVFLGIPYAAAPSAARRWQAPQAAATFTTPLQATAFGAICPQNDIGLGVPPGKADEDCLTLNVFAPYPAPTKAAPVMVWIHGGGFTIGASSTATYNGRSLVETHGVVVVTLNYRLGPLGFLAHPALGGASGNYGFQDQQAALGWVQKNIAAFGGDPKNVTLFGESAGSISVCAHLASPSSKGLFHRAIMQSGPCTYRLMTKSEAEAQGKQLATQLGCEGRSDVAACLRQKTSQQLLDALALKPGLILGTGASWGPIIDGTVLPLQPYQAITGGTYNKVPVMLGSNRDEGTLFAMAASLVSMSQSQYDALLTQIFGSDASKVAARYPASSYKSPAQAFADLFGDMSFICANRRGARALAAAGSKTFLYHFTRVPSQQPIAFLGCNHGAEIPFVWNTPLVAYKTDEESLSRAMMGYWTRFAQAGDPAGSGAVSWPAYDAATDGHLTLDLTIAAGQQLKKSLCDFWDSLLSP